MVVVNTVLIAAALARDSSMLCCTAVSVFTMKANSAELTSSIRATVLLLLMQLNCEFLVVVGLSSSMNYKLMEDEVVPTSGMTTVGTILVDLSSAVQPNATN